MKILVVDDDPGRCDPLIALGHEVVLAHTPCQVTYWLQAQAFDAVILDHDLDGRWADEGRGDIRVSGAFDMTGMWVLQQSDAWSSQPVWIWSWNPRGAEAMAARLLAGWGVEAEVRPWTADRDEVAYYLDHLVAR